MQKNLLNTREILFIIGSAFIFIIPALYNGFPLVTSDTGTYIASAMDNNVPNDRPAIYSFFVRFISLRDSLWFVVFFQGILLSLILSVFIKTFFPDYFSIKYRLLIFSMLTYFTSLPWFTSQIMADAFSSCWILSIAILLFGNQSKGGKVFTAVLFILSSMMHNSFMLTNLLIITSIFLIYVLKKSIRSQIEFKKLLLFACLSVGAWIITPTINYFIDKKFRVSGSPHIFIMARLAETGILEKYLSKECNWIHDLKKISPKTEYIISAKHSKFALDVTQGKSADGTPVQQYHYGKTNNQQFRIVKNPDSLFSIVSTITGKVLSVSNADFKNGTPICIAKDTVGNGQRFVIEEANNGFYTFRVPGTKFLFDIANRSKSNEAPLQIWDKSDGDNQQFRFTEINNCVFCMYNDEVPNNTINFIWEEGKMFSLTGGWLNSKEEYNSVIFDILSKPKFFLWFMRDAVISTARQLTQIDVAGGFETMPVESPPGWAIRDKLSRDVNQFAGSRQARGFLGVSDVNKRVLLSMLISLLILGLYLFNSTKDTLFKKVVYLFILVIVYNAFVTGALANVLDRLHSRVFWVLPLTAILVSLSYWVPWIKKKSTEI